MNIPGLASAAVTEGASACGSASVTSDDSEMLSRLGNASAKRLIDLSLSTAIILLFLPMIICIIGLLLACQGRPIFIKHRRVGKGGDSFLCYKFRTMVRNADQILLRHLSSNPEAKAEWDKGRKLKHDPRVTSIGKILRKTSLDEVPQLMNILAGEMSLVGPRPIVQEEVERYGGQIRYYHCVQPGLTGLWQVSGRSTTSYDARVKLDVEYVRTRSIARDVLILVKTIPAVLTSKGSY